MRHDETIEVTTSADELRIETRRSTLVERALWSAIWLIWTAVGVVGLIASFSSGSGSTLSTILFGLMGSSGIALLIRTWTLGSSITITPSRIRWRIGSRLYRRRHDVELADVTAAEVQVKTRRAKDGTSSDTYFVSLRLRGGDRVRLAVFSGWSPEAASELIDHVERRLPD